MNQQPAQKTHSNLMGRIRDQTFPFSGSTTYYIRVSVLLDIWSCILLLDSPIALPLFVHMTWTAYKTFSLSRRAHNTLFNLSTLFLSLHVSSQFLFFFEGGLLVFLSTCHPLSPVITLYVRIKTRFVFPPILFIFLFFSFLFLSFFLYVLVNVPRSRAINTRRQHMQIYISRNSARALFKSSFWRFSRPCNEFVMYRRSTHELL